MRQLNTLLLAALAISLFCGADWLQFRGDGSGIASGTIPASWDAESGKNIAWKVKLPGKGAASPIVVKDRVIVSCSGGVKQDRLHVLAFEVASGKQLWHRQFWATGRCLSHPQSGNAAPTPASDGERIFAFYSSNDLICLDLNGNLQWYRGLAVDYPKAGNDVGMSASPLVIGDTVIVQVENQGDSFATGVDASTGEERWRIRRDRVANWASPARLPRPGKSSDLLLLQSPSGLTAHHPANGQELWRFDAACAGIPSPTATADRIFIASQGITALKLDAEGTAPEVAWESAKMNPPGPSPVVHDGRVYTINRGGVVSCGDAATGDSLWQLRIGGTFWGTPVVVGKQLLCVSYQGDATLVDVSGEKGKVAAVNKMGEPLQGTPAVVDGAVFLRSDQHLWKVARPK